ncbi:MAG: twin-arginine translocation signal domain-containing protein, partial [Caldilineaceae bacterium]|nr:twin-arginine translocation signal domain-containing protein [Caldilineaceae bacterium]
MLKKNVSRRQFLAGSLAASGALALSACVPAAPTAGDGGESMEASTEPVTVLFHTRLGTHADWHKSRKDLFEEQNPGI